MHKNKNQKISTKLGGSARDSEATVREGFLAQSFLGVRSSASPNCLSDASLWPVDMVRPCRLLACCALLSLLHRGFVGLHQVKAGVEAAERRRPDSN